MKTVIPAKREARRAGTTGGAELAAVPGLRCAPPGMTAKISRRSAIASALALSACGR